MPLSQYSSTFHKLLDEAHIHKVGKGTTLATTDNTRGVFCVRKGFVKRYLIKNDGSISVQGIYGPGDCFGITTLSRLLIRDNAYNGAETYYYEAINDAIVYEIDIKTLQKALPSHQELYKDFFTIQGWHSLSDVWRLENQGIKGALNRVAHIICFYMERYGIQSRKGWEFKVPFIQQDLADILDLSRETVSIAISELKRDGLVKGQRKIIIPDLEKLKEKAYQ